MDKKEFNELLKKAGITKKKFAELVGYEYGTVANWGGKDKDFPAWVKLFLTNYIKAKTLDSVKDVICEAPDSAPIGEETPADNDEVRDG